MKNQTNIHGGARPGAGNAETRKVTPLEYGAIRGISKQAVAKAIRNSHALPGVVDIEIVGGRYIIEVSREWERSIGKTGA